MNANRDSKCINSSEPSTNLNSISPHLSIMFNFFKSSICIFITSFCICFLQTTESKNMSEVVTLALNKKFIESRKKLLDTRLNNGLSGLDVIKQIQKEVINRQM